MESLRFQRSLAWEEGSDLETAFYNASEWAVEGAWINIAELLKQNPELCCLRKPEGDWAGAGYGLLRTLCAKAAPDWLTDYVVHRAPMDVIGFACNEMFSGVPPLIGFDLPPPPHPPGRLRSRTFLI